MKGKISVALLMMKINLSLLVLLPNLMQVLAIIKETISYDAKGQVIRYRATHKQIDNTSQQL